MNTPTHAIWTLTGDGWDTDGVLLPEHVAVREARTQNHCGIPALALPLGKEPEHLHPAERPIRVVA